MIQIFLDGKPAIPQDNINVKLTIENPYFTKSASYTYDVELPIAIDENRKIFGWIERMDIHKENRTFDAVLMADNVTLLNGTAHITAVTGTVVKIQLLGDSAAYNFENKIGNLFIDELNLGDWFSTTWPDLKVWAPVAQQWVDIEDKSLRGSSAPVWGRTFGECEAVLTGKDFQRQLDNIYRGDYPWVAYPTYNSTADVVVNAPAYVGEPSTPGCPYSIGGRENADPRYPRDYSGTSLFCVQPFLWLMVEKIAQATGYNLNRQDNIFYTDDFLKRIFLVNANNSILCNAVLPHWSVNEWWSNLEESFGVVISINSLEKRLEIKKKYHYYNDLSNIIHLDSVVDEYSVDVDGEAIDDISTASVGFSSFEAGREDILDENIYQSARLDYTFENIRHLHSWGKGNRELVKSYKNTIFVCKDGRQYIYTTAHAGRMEGFVEVNMLRPRIKDEGKGTDVDIDLKFIPAGTSYQDFYYFERDSTAANPKIGSVQGKVLQRPDVDIFNESTDFGEPNIDLETVIFKDEGEDTSTKEETKEDNVYIAIDTRGYTNQFYNLIGSSYILGAQYPAARVRAQNHAALDLELPYEDKGASLSLIPIAGQQNLASLAIDGSTTIKRAVKNCVSFLADNLPKVSSIFVIHGKRFVCEKIEVQINNAGMEKLLTGYFYEIDL